MSSYSACTLYEGDHHFGVAALINSVHKSGFSGTFYVGYRGELPSWAHESAASPTGWEILPGLIIRFELVQTKEHMAHLKPLFMAEVLESPQFPSRGLIYFDTDIVIRAPWHFFEQWVECGVALCGHERTYPLSHPFRLEWLRLGETLGYEMTNPMTDYINSGFVGLKKDQSPFLRQWRAVIEALPSVGVGVNDFQTLDATHPWSMTDQSALNLVAMTTPFPISVIGGEAMDFSRQGSVMSHAAGGRKPWRGNHFRQALKGLPPNKATLEWARYLDGPIRPYSNAQVAAIRKDLRWASLLGRFYRNENSSHYPPA